MGLYDHYTEVQGQVLDESQQWAQHAVQAVVWNVAGRNRLSGIEWDIVLANTVPGSNDDNRLHAVLWKAYQVHDTTSADYEWNY
jgi:anaphase-promoting complex subunit 5